ncbi:hypothetical protein HELRODRAFT_91460, partial [Helobdella robusta]|uniref:Purine nucleoside phosphorylase n=1 Tax=Helobdella robusta TaxID=6412 RepID=T1G841_HELRO
DYIFSKTAQRPKIAIVCGSGLGGITGILKDPELISYKDIPNFPISSVPGHAGKLVFGKLGNKDVVCMSGRVHAYEGQPLWKVTFAMRVFDSMGIKVVILTNAAGGVGEKTKEGDLIILKDHINLPGLCGFNPLVGLNDERFGARFQETTVCYDKELRDIALKMAKDCKMDFVCEGVYIYQVGPTFESPSEVKFLKLIGGDMVGMSTVPEVVVARHRGMRCLGISLITNKCIDVFDSNKKPNHEEVLELSKQRSCELQKLISKIVDAISLEQASACGI